MTSTTSGPDRDMVDCGDRLDAQLAHLIEAVWACERAARSEDRLDAVIAAAARYGQGR
jgi:hypothetical protein